MFGWQTHDSIESLTPEAAAKQFQPRATDSLSADDVGESLPRVEHDDRLATTTQYTVDLADGTGRVGRMVQYPVAVDQGEGLIREREVLCISAEEFAGQIRHSKALPCERKRLD